LWLAEHLAGQRLAGSTDALGNPHDGPPLGTPHRPLSVVAGPPGRNLVVATHRGFGSNALFPVGPAGAASVRGRGEGAVALLFDAPQRAIALRIHAAYPDPLGAQKEPGAERSANVWFQFVPDDGAPCRLSLAIAPGVQDIGFRADDGALRAVVIWNTDPGGIAIDDIAYDVAALTG